MRKPRTELEGKRDSVDSLFKFFTRKVLVTMRIGSVLLLCIALPRYLSISADSEQVAFAHAPLKLGVENLTQPFMHHFSAPGKKGPRVALVTNHTGVDQLGQRAVDILRDNNVNVVTMYVPEHGFSGQIGAEMKIHDEQDSQTGLPILSLYKGNSQIKEFSPRELEGIDAFFFDMQDSGMRHYTYFPTLYKLMEMAARNNKKIVVFDRPNPLGGVMEGPTVDKPYHSFISIASYPLRHGMTLGELALYCNKKCLSKSCDLFIVPMKGYDRFAHAGSELVVGLSPQIATIDAAKGYSFMGVLGEVSPIHTGVGTPHGFQFIGIEQDKKIPMRVWYELKRKLAPLGISSKAGHIYNPRTKKKYSGLTISIDSIQTFEGLPVLLTVIDHLKHVRGITLSSKPTINKSYGTACLQNYVAGTIRRSDLINTANKQLKTFYSKAQPYFIYKPHPRACLH